MSCWEAWLARCMLGMSAYTPESMVPVSTERRFLAPRWRSARRSMKAVEQKSTTCPRSLRKMAWGVSSWRSEVVASAEMLQLEPWRWSAAGVGAAPAPRRLAIEPPRPKELPRSRRGMWWRSAASPPWLRCLDKSRSVAPVPEPRRRMSRVLGSLARRPDVPCGSCERSGASSSAEEAAAAAGAAASSALSATPPPPRTRDIEEERCLCARWGVLPPPAEATAL
mmetsp:Transcript_17569/g.54757  ORF Transcript_17569/g.54757 Transcript_17569/m.54757 type:complete len:224 (-) Transcript_17569:2989-3660(-)